MGEPVTGIEPRHELGRHHQAARRRVPMQLRSYGGSPLLTVVDRGEPLLGHVRGTVDSGPGSRRAVLEVVAVVEAHGDHGPSSSSSGAGRRARRSVNRSQRRPIPCSPSPWIFGNFACASFVSITLDRQEL
jgi:hypothetical protein